MLQQATHIHSGTRGQVIGLNKQRKATMIQLSNGSKQYWRNESILMEGNNMEDTINFKLYKKDNSIERYFESEEEAVQYLQELTCFNDLSDFSNNNQEAKVSNGWKLECNQDLKILLKKKPKITSATIIKIPRKTQEENLPKKSKSKKVLTGDIVKLQSLTKDPRKARVILRGLVRDKKITKPSRWEWSEGSTDLEIVRAALK